MTAKVVRQLLEGRGGGFVFPGPNQDVGGARVLGLGSWRPSATAMSEGDRRGGGLGHLWAVGGSEGLAGPESRV